MFVLQLIRPSSPKGFSRNIRGQLGSQIRWFNKFVSANKSKNLIEFSFGINFFDFLTEVLFSVATGITMLVVTLLWI